MQQRQQQQQQQQCATGDIVRMDMEMMWEGLPCFDLWAGFEGLGSLGSDFLRKEQGGEEGVRSCLLVAVRCARCIPAPAFVPTSTLQQG